MKLIVRNRGPFAGAHVQEKLNDVPVPETPVRAWAFEIRIEMQAVRLNLEADSESIAGQAEADFDVFGVLDRGGVNESERLKHREKLRDSRGS